MFIIMKLCLIYNLNDQLYSFYRNGHHSQYFQKAFILRKFLFIGTVHTELFDVKEQSYNKMKSKCLSDGKLL